MEYQYIINTKTNRKCRIDSRLGKQIIKQYTIQSGGASHAGPRDLSPADRTELDQLANLWWNRGTMVWHSDGQIGYYFTNLGNSYFSPTHLHIYSVNEVYHGGTKFFQFNYSMKKDNRPIQLETNNFIVPNKETAVRIVTDLCRTARNHIFPPPQKLTWVNPNLGKS